jgi:hypothetical protein
LCCVGIHAAAKETISLAEVRFLDNSGEWQFDNAWQEMLNHATIKVTRYANTLLGMFESVLRIRIRRMRMFLGLLDPDLNLLMRGTDPDLSIIKQK